MGSYDSFKSLGFWEIEFTEEAKAIFAGKEISENTNFTSLVEIYLYSQNSWTKQSLKPKIRGERKLAVWESVFENTKVEGVKEYADHWIRSYKNKIHSLRSDGVSAEAMQVILEGEEISESTSLIACVEVWIYARQKEKRKEAMQKFEKETQFVPWYEMYRITNIKGAKELALRKMEAYAQTKEEKFEVRWEKTSIEEGTPCWTNGWESWTKKR